MDKNAIKKFAIWARRELISRVSQKALQYGISAEEHGNPDADNVNGRILTPVEQQQRRSLIQKINADGYEQAMEEAAYTWFNRFTALRYMEVNGYLPSHVRVFTNEENAFKPQILAEAIHLDPDDFEGLDMEKIYAYKDANDTETLFKYLLIMQCNAFSKSLPGMFTSIMDFTVLLFPDNLLREGSVIEQMIAMIPEEDWKDQVQIIGWLYQYYNSEKKDAVFAAMSQKIKVSKENIAPATQLFTPDWIVRYMVENSLGRLWVDGHPDTTARADWKYYLEEAEQTPEVQAQLAEIRESRKDLTPEQIRFIDPCMGSGHILVYAFDVLMQIYLSYGYSEREAAESIVRNNLWGLDLDKRAYQLAYFAVMMKGRQYDRRFLKKVIKPNLSHFQDLPQVDVEMLDEPVKSFVEQFENADTYGSLISVNGAYDTEELQSLYINPESMEHLVLLYKMLSQKYDVVCTNPPYMGSNSMNAMLSNFLKKNYPDSKTDLFAVFIEKCSKYIKNAGYYAMITQHAWMFLSSYEKLREKIQNSIIINMAHLGPRAFDEISGEVVQTTAFVNCNLKVSDYFGVYKRLIDGTNEKTKNTEFFNESNNYYANTNNYSLIPGKPIAYWLPETQFEQFKKDNIGNNYIAKVGLMTTDNDRFLRYFWEVQINGVCFSATDSVSAMKSKKKWFPHNKGGVGRKWYGNQDYVVDWENNGERIKETAIEKYPYLNGNPNFVVHDDGYYFKENISWSELGGWGFR